MARTRVVLNLPGINAVMTSDPVAADLLSRAERIASAAGEGFEASPGAIHPWVARAYVYPTTREARVREATDRVLARAVNAGR